MNRLAVPLSILAAAAMGATIPQAVAQTPPATPIATQYTNFQAGSGVIFRISAAPGTLPGGARSAAAGSSTPPGAPLNRLHIRMDNGQTQYVDTDNNEFRSGMRVDLAPDRMIKKR